MKQAKQWPLRLSNSSLHAHIHTHIYIYTHIVATYYTQCGMMSRPVRDVREAGEAMATLIELAPSVVDAALRTLFDGSEPNLPTASTGEVLMYKKCCDLECF